jgi:hypothetical protein
VVEARWPDSRPVFWNPVPFNGARRRCAYEDQNARISILAGHCSETGYVGVD